MREFLTLVRDLTSSLFIVVILGKQALKEEKKIAFREKKKKDSPIAKATSDIVLFCLCPEVGKFENDRSFDHARSAWNPDFLSPLIGVEHLCQNNKALRVHPM